MDTQDTDDLPKRVGLLRPIAEMSSELLQLEKQTFEIAFESVLEHIVNGRTFESFCSSYHIPMLPARFRTWIYKDQRRRQQYTAAKAVGAEAIEDELIRIADGMLADGTASPDDVARSTLRINTRKWIMQISNRKRYGDVKHIEQTTTTRFDASSISTKELQERVLRSLGVDVDSSELEGHFGVVPDALDGFDATYLDEDNG